MPNGGGGVSGSSGYSPTLMELAQKTTMKILSLEKENADLKHQIEMLNAQLKDLSTTIKTFRRLTNMNES